MDLDALDYLFVAAAMSCPSREERALSRPRRSRRSDTAWCHTRESPGTGQFSTMISARRQPARTHSVPCRSAVAPDGKAAHSLAHHATPRPASTN